jgi:plasmid stability protein
MTYTISNVPDEIDRALRARAAAEQKSPEQAILDSLARDLGVSTSSNASCETKRDLSDIAGTGGIDDEMEAVFWEHRRIDPEIWK